MWDTKRKVIFDINFDCSLFNCFSVVSEDKLCTFPSLVNLSCRCLGITTLGDLLLSMLSVNTLWHQQATALLQTESQGLGINLLH